MIRNTWKKWKKIKNLDDSKFGQGVPPGQNWPASFDIEAIMGAFKRTEGLTSEAVKAIFDNPMSQQEQNERDIAYKEFFAKNPDLFTNDRAAAFAAAAKIIDSPEAVAKRAAARLAKSAKPPLR